ncbi:cagY like domain protein [Helicobacter pylori]|nr:cagY like domain protein [Helicobacter pylori]
MLVCPIKPLMGRDEILQQTPLKLLILQTLKTRLKN